MASASNQPVENFLGCLGFISFLVIFAVIRGFLLTTLWAWFIVPLGQPALTIPLAIGISLIVGFFNITKKETVEWGHVIAQPFVIFFLAWITHFFV